MKKRDIAPKIQKHLSRLHEYIPILLQVSSEVTQAAGTWTPLKLYVLDYYMNIYTPIIKRHFRKMYFIDLLAGSGISELDDNQSVVGSPIIAATFPKRPFNKLLLAESEKISRDALISRLNRLPNKPDYEVFTDCNKEINQICDIINEPGSHYLAFVDCARVEVYWETIRNLLKFPGDLIFNFQTSVIGRMTGSAKHSRNQTEISRLTAFFGDSYWLNQKSREANLEYYKLNLSNLRDLVESVRIRSKRGKIPYFYDLIIAAKQTSGGSKWFEPVYSLKKDIEVCTGNDVRRIRDVLLGKSRELPFFYHKEQQMLTNWHDKKSKNSN